MNKHLNHALILTLLVLILGFSITMVVFSLDLKHVLVTEPTPTFFLEIFFHNLLFIVIYSIPVLGFVYFMYSFTTIFIAIGLLFTHIGVVTTLARLWHLPLELFSFALVLTMKPKTRIKPILIAVLMLFVASILEFYI